MSRYIFYLFMNVVCIWWLVLCFFSVIRSRKGDFCLFFFFRFIHNIHHAHIIIAFCHWFHTPSLYVTFVFLWLLLLLVSFIFTLFQHFTFTKSRKPKMYQTLLALNDSTLLSLLIIQQCCVSSCLLPPASMKTPSDP